MIFAYIIALIIIIVMFGPALVAAIGSFLSTVLFVVALVVTAPAVLLLAGKDIKERDAIRDNLDEARKRYDYTRIEMYERHLKDAEERVNDKINVIFLFFIIIVFGLSIFLSI